VQRTFKCSDVQHTKLTPDEELIKTDQSNIWNAFLRKRICDLQTLTSIPSNGM